MVTLLANTAGQTTQTAPQPHIEATRRKVEHQDDTTSRLGHSVSKPVVFFLHTPSLSTPPVSPPHSCHRHSLLISFQATMLVCTKRASRGKHSEKHRLGGVFHQKTQCTAFAIGVHFIGQWRALQVPSHRTAFLDTAGSVLSEKHPSPKNAVRFTYLRRALH